MGFQQLLMVQFIVKIEKGCRWIIFVILWEGFEKFIDFGIQLKVIHDFRPILKIHGPLALFDFV